MDMRDPSFQGTAGHKGSTDLESWLTRCALRLFQQTATLQTRPQYSNHQHLPHLTLSFGNFARLIQGGALGIEHT